MTLQVWDPDLAANRPASQEDIDILQAKVDAYGRIVFDIAGVKGTLESTIRQIRAKYRVTEELSGDVP